MKIFARKDSLPLRPEPFVFRLQWKPGAEWAGRALEEIAAAASVIQLEADGILNNELLVLLRELDFRPEKFSLGLLLRPGESMARATAEFIGPLSRLKKLSALIVIMSCRTAEKSLQLIKEALSAATSAGLKPGVMVELEPDTPAAELERLVREVRLAGALEIALRPASLSNQYLAAGQTLSDCLKSLRAAGIPVQPEECLSGLEPGTPFSEPSCRRAYGSCYLDSQGQVRACRQSEKILGDIRNQKLAEIWSDYLLAEELCPKTAITAQSLKLEANGTARAENFSSASLDSSLKPVPLFTLKKKEWGAVLIKGLDGLVLSPKGEKLARMINGKNSLGSIRKKFGQRSAGLIYALFLRGFVRLEK